MKLRIGKYTACVVVDGEERECYDVRTSDDGKTVECWIVSEVGKEFSVDYTFMPNVVAHAALYIDGVNSRAFVVNYPRPRSDPAHSIKSLRTSPTTEKSLQFADIELTEDDQFLCEGNAAKENNTLKLHLRLARYTGHAKPLVRNTPSLPGSKKIHERTKKGLLAHGIGLGQEVTVSPPKGWDCHYIGDIGTFIFRYTSRDILMAQGIIKSTAPDPITSTPSPEPPTAEAGEGDALRQQILSLQKRLEEVEGASSTANRVKREREDTLDLTGSGDPAPTKKRHKSMR